MSGGRKAAEQALAAWLERDLSAAPLEELAPAFEVEGLIEQVVQILDSGRHPVLMGPPGVGKTAVIVELVRRSRTGSGPARLLGGRILQLSLRRRLSSLAQPHQLRPEMQKLVDALQELPEVVPVVSDFDLGGPFDLEHALLAIAGRGERPVLGEGSRSGLLSMFEDVSELAERFVLVDVEEPDLPRAGRLLGAWAAHRAERGGPAFSASALDEALHLAHRFLSRGHLPRKAIDLLSQVASVAPPQGSPIEPRQVIDRFCAVQRVPRALVDPAERLDLDATAGWFAERVLGQPEAVRAVMRMVALVKAGLTDPRRPFGVFLFVGPTGVGKTHLAQALATFLFGAGDRMLRFNMADFEREQDALTLFGDPDQAPYLRRGLLTRRLAGHPFAVLLLDEFEKAHERVHDRFLQLVDEGAFINGAGETISCRSTVVIATSNAGAEVFRGQALGFPTALDDLEELDREVDRRLQQRFRFEFLNRFDQVVHFHPLTREDIRTIARRELEQMRERRGLVQRSIGLEVDDSVLDWLTVNGYDPHYGARALRRTIERHVSTALAEALVRAERVPASLTLTVRRNRIEVRQEAAPPAARLAVRLPEGRQRLDPGQLRAEALRLMAEARPRLLRLDERSEERSRLLARLNADAWDGSTAEARAALERYRELDVELRAEERLARPLRALESVEGGSTALAARLEQAAAALAEWRHRDAEAPGAGAAWLAISSLDPVEPAWVRDLVSLELLWCQGLGLSAATVAYESAGERLARAVIEVEGRGIGALQMEVGLHRLAPARGSAARARIDVVPRSAGPFPERPLRARRPAVGLLGLRPAWRGRGTVPLRGLAFDLLAVDADTLRHLLADLEQAWQQPAEPQTARVYAESGVGARDPRTGATVPRLKDALKGRLAPLLTAWRERRVG